MDSVKREVLPTFGAEVRRLRLRSKMSQEKLAEKLSVSRETVSDIERGVTKRPGDDILEGIEIHLGLTRLQAHELMGAVPGSDQEDPSAILLRIAALPDHASRMAEWAKLPDQLRLAVYQWSQDLLLDAALRVRESSLQTNHHQANGAGH